VSNALKKPTALASTIAIVQDLTQDWGIDEGVQPGRETLLADQLMFTSVDIIQLCVALEECYECRFGFHDLLMVDGSYIGDLSIGRLADFVERQLTTQTQPTYEAATI